MWELSEYSKVSDEFFCKRKHIYSMKELELEIMTTLLFFVVKNIKEIPNYPITDIDQIKIINTFNLPKNFDNNLLQMCQYVIDTTEINYNKKYAKSDCPNMHLFFQWNEL